MKTTHIVKHIAILFSLGVAASANAQLLGGGLGGSAGGMVGGAGTIGGSIGGMGRMEGRGSLIHDVRSSSRAVDTGALRGSADVARSGRAAADVAGNGSASGSLTGNIMPERSAGADAAGSGFASGNLGAEVSVIGSGRDAAGKALGSLRDAGRPVADGVRSQANSTRELAMGTAANAGATARAARQGVTNGVRRAGNAAGSVQVDQSIDASGSASGNASVGAAGSSRGAIND